jgi:PleD family two-component response regulator
LISAADQALYRSKHDGRDRVTQAAPVASGLAH